MSSTSLRQVPSRRLLRIALVGAAVWLGVALLFQYTSGGWTFDLKAYLLAAERLIHGAGLYQPVTLAGPFRPGPAGLYLYAPPLAVAAMPLALLSHGAGLIWWAVHIAALALMAAVMPVRKEIKVAIFVIATVSQPVLKDLLLGNVSVLVVALSAVVWRWVDKPLGGIALAAALTVRPTLGIVLLWALLRRRWRLIVWTALAGVVLIAVTLPIVGIGGYLDYVTVLRNIANVTSIPNNVDLGTIAIKYGANSAIVTAALVAGYGVAIGAMLLSLRRDREISLMVTLTASLLLSPLLWDHYLASLLLPAAFLAQRGKLLGLGLPLLAWLQVPFLPFVVIVATIAPLAVPDRAPAEEAVQAREVTRATALGTAPPADEAPEAGTVA